MQYPRYQIKFPREDLTKATQDESHFTISINGKEDSIGFHEYSKIYSYRGLYEQLYYERLQCNSPETVTRLLHHAATKAGEASSRFRVLDFGAGNGMVGELLVQQGSARVVGIDILEEAAAATQRDRPGFYDAYYVGDITQFSEDQIEELRQWNFNALTTVAALGFGDIPVHAFSEAYNLLTDNGWVAFNIKEQFLDSSDNSGFSQLIRKMMYKDFLKIHHIERYCHRLSIEGRKLYYYAIVARKHRDIDSVILNN